MSYYSILKGQLAWKDVLPPGKTSKKKQLDKPKLKLLPKNKTDKMEEAFKRELKKEIAERKKDKRATATEFKEYKKERHEAKKLALKKAMKAVMETSPARYKEWLAAQAHLGNIKGSDPLFTDLY